MKRFAFASLIGASLYLHADVVPLDKMSEEGLIAGNMKGYLLTRADNLPIDTFEDATDPYLEGYIQALVDVHYYEFQVIVTVKDHKVYLSNLPKNELIANSIIAFIKDLPDVDCVVEQDCVSKEEIKAREKYVERPCVEGVWFPQSTVLFLPLVADPREPVYSVNARVDDRVMGRKAIAVSLGDDFPIFRWYDMFRWHGDLQIGISAGIWSVFNFEHLEHHAKERGEACELVNTDYLVGFPLTYAFDKYSFRLRYYHISSHLGDECMVNNHFHVTNRKNPSFEAIDFFTSYQFSSGLRGYFGPGVITHSDPSFPMKYFYVQWGAELRILGQKLNYHRLYGTPFLAMHMENWQYQNWTLNSNFKLGYEISKLQGIGRKMRMYIAYHHGYSVEGQFQKFRTQYSELGLSWGF